MLSPFELKQKICCFWALQYCCILMDLLRIFAADPAIPDAQERSREPLLEELRKLGCINLNFLFFHPHYARCFSY